MTPLTYIDSSRRGVWSLTEKGRIANIDDTERQSILDEVKEAAKALEGKLVELEMNLVDLRLTGQGQDGVRFEAKLLSKLRYLTRGLAHADFRPTDQEMEVREILHGQVGEQVNALEALVAQDVAAFNGFLREKGVGIIGG